MQEINTAITFTGVTANNARNKYCDYLYRVNSEQCKKKKLFITVTLVKMNNTREKILSITVTLVKTDNTRKKYYLLLLH